MKFKSFKNLKVCLMIKIKFLARKFLYSNFWKILFCKHYFISVRSTLLWEKGKDPDPDPNLWLTDPDAKPRGPKGYGSYGSRTLSRPIATVAPMEKLVTRFGRFSSHCLQCSRPADKHRQKSRKDYTRWFSGFPSISTISLPVNCPNFLLLL